MRSPNNQDWLLETLREVSDEVDGWADWMKTPDLIAASAARAARAGSKCGAADGHPRQAGHAGSQRSKKQASA